MRLMAGYEGEPGRFPSHVGIDESPIGAVDLSDLTQPKPGSFDRSSVLVRDPITWWRH